MTGQFQSFLRSCRSEVFFSVKFAFFSRMKFGESRIKDDFSENPRFRMKLEFGNVVFCGERKNRRVPRKKKNIWTRTRTNNKLHPCVAFKSWRHRWVASTLIINTISASLAKSKTFLAHNRITRKRETLANHVKNWKNDLKRVKKGQKQPL